MKQILRKLVEGKDLEEVEAEEAMRLMMEGKVSEAEIAAFLTALRMKGETPREIAAFARVMRDFALRIEPKVDGSLVDVCGTGGDALNTFNISTTAMFIVAGAGCYVAKHGNRAVSSKCGSADVIEALGISLEMAPEQVKECIEKVGIGFMFAPLYHRATANVMPVRRKLGFRTVFNILGPLTNPAGADSQLLGVFASELTEKLASVMKLLGLRRGLVVHGEPGLDELSTLGKTKISELRGGAIRTYYVKPEELGLRRISELSLIAGGSVEENARILVDVLRGEADSAKMEIVLLNAAAGIVAEGKADDLREGLEVARDVLEEGKAYEKLLQLQEFCKKARGSEL